MLRILDKGIHSVQQNLSLAFLLSTKGSIETGKLADLVVLSKDYAKCPEDEIKDIEALRTVVGGKVVYDRLR